MAHQDFRPMSLPGYHPSSSHEFSPPAMRPRPMHAFAMAPVAAHPRDPLLRMGGVVWDLPGWPVMPPSLPRWDPSGRRSREVEMMMDAMDEAELDVDNMSYEELLELGEKIGKVSTGLSETQLEAIAPCTVLDPEELLTLESESCCICMSEYEEAETIRRFPCCHVYHQPCIDRWLRDTHICPVCKGDVREMMPHPGDPQ
mmetsp:Transcript_120157/g.209189  ORF Transcript_120157/g.209189 Transcript_120157/m.209189 type:complete len:200 (-) Transcript_120157:570-1169(-)